MYQCMKFEKQCNGMFFDITAFLFFINFFDCAEIKNHILKQDEGSIIHFLCHPTLYIGIHNHKVWGEFSEQIGAFTLQTFHYNLVQFFGNLGFQYVNDLKCQITLNTFIIRAHFI